ncbi:hypothetical protein [Nonlabens tegetincola]|uniref:hypothetical protein n=1 Tax=Nonlabens tegetincola TaxID=323273 RepID=UPI000CF4A870|nr:hypothetical protein [Nonlabens tegetincola]MEE2801695.1 hypothetical protein [Bacteroidota bacterium]PQJ14061.1 hypothetical protein BST93_12470 [Nonlabens tegetincola]
MKNIIILAVLLISTTAIAQRGDRSNREERENRIETLFIAYVTDKLELTTDEAAKFWPIYNEIKQERRALEKKKRALINEIDDNMQAMSDQQAQSYVNKVIALEKEINLKSFENRSKEIIAVVGAKRFLLLKKSEVEFRRKMISEFKKKRRRD